MTCSSASAMSVIKVIFAKKMSAKCKNQNKNNKIDKVVSIIDSSVCRTLLLFISNCF